MAETQSTRDGKETLGDAVTFCRFAQDCLQRDGSSFPALKATVAETFSNHQGAEELQIFIVRCIEVCLNPEAGISPAVAHLLVDALPQSLVGKGPPGSSAASAAVFLSCVALQPRLAVKLALALDLSTAQLSVAQQCQLLDAISVLLDSGNSAAGVALLLQFPDLLQHFDVDAILEDVVLSNDHAVAARFVGVLGRELQQQYIQYCMQYAQLRAASMAVKQFGLQAVFPDVERLYRARQLEKLADKGLWGVAAERAREHLELQQPLLQHLLLAGELSLAAEYAHLFGMPPPSAIDPAELEAERQRRREAYLQLELPQTCVHWVDSVVGLRTLQQSMQQLMERGDSFIQKQPASADAPISHPLACLGVDAEWRPDCAPGEARHAVSLLQLGTGAEVFLLDLLALGSEQEAMAAALQPVLASNAVYKVGCGLATDFKRLAATCPGAFATVRGALDLSSLWREMQITQSGRRSTAGFRRRSAEVSLSALTEAVLGKPLDKSVQVSDWEQRPLKDRQLTYAALDAHAAAGVFWALGRLHPPFSTVEGLQPHTFTWQTASLRDLPGRARRQGPPGGGDDSQPASSRAGGGCAPQPPTASSSALQGSTASEFSGTGSAAGQQRQHQRQPAAAPTLQLLPQRLARLPLRMLRSV